MAGKRQPIMVGEAHNILLKFIVQYSQQTRATSAKKIVEQLIIAYAKQMVTGVIDDNQRKVILHLINKAENK